MNSVLAQNSPPLAWTPNRSGRATYLFIANPCARNDRARQKLSRLRAELDRRGVKYDLALCPGLDNARVLSEEANRAGYEVIVGVGGDGTINRVLNGFFDPQGRRLSRARMGAVHVGTSPDFCRSYGIPVKVSAAVDTLVEGVARPIRVGKITCSTGPRHKGTPGTSFFGCCANIGLGASLARLANGGIRKYAGDFLGTFASLLRVLLRYRPTAVRLEADRRPQSLDRVYNLAVGKTRYIASGIQVRHELQEQDERLYLLCLQNLTWTRLGQILWVLYSGRPFFPNRCLSLSYARSVRLSGASAPLEVEFDGDAAGWCPCQIETASDPLDLIVGGTP
jgi:diacylglycerol kinase family enzyme